MKRRSGRKVKRLRRKSRPRKPRKRRRKKQSLFRRSERAISLGVELESYSIAIPDYRISRELKFPRRGSAEKGERFTRDFSIGSEYNSKVFFTIREAFFLLRNGLRKYIHYRSFPKERNYHTLFPVGGWKDRFAGTHIHVALGKKKFDETDARLLARRLHAHIPFLIALTGNSPVWREKVKPLNSARLLFGSSKYCKITRKKSHFRNPYSEIMFNRGGKRKPPTLEIRIPDSGVPEYIIAAACIVKAVALRWLERRPAYNQLSHENYILAREEAVRRGPEAKLFWNRHKLGVPAYTDLFFRKYEGELNRLRIPSEIIDIFKYLKKEWNQSTVIRKAVQKSRWHHRPTWQRRFAKRYAVAIERLLDGNSYYDFAKTLGVRLPSIERTWLARRDSRW